MTQFPDILKTVFKTEVPSLPELVFENTQLIPGSVNYAIARYSLQKTVIAEEAGLLTYSINKTKPEDSFLQLSFCTIRTRFSQEKKGNVSNDTIDVFHFNFTSVFLNQFVQNVKLNNRKDEVLAFRYPQSFTKLFPLCSRKRAVLEALLTHDYKGAMENVFVNAKVHELLLYSIDCLIDEKEEGFSCRFLADESGRERIYQARDILLQRIGEPITIKELSRKVATNECYLKKGFKEVFGTTIFDFYQQQRMEHAKYLLYEKGLSVTDVSALLGYSSISHFSAAFKKHTGLKPCDLLH